MNRSSPIGSSGTGRKPSSATQLASPTQAGPVGRASRPVRPRAGPRCSNVTAMPSGISWIRSGRSSSSPSRSTRPAHTPQRRPRLWQVGVAFGHRVRLAMPRLAASGSRACPAAPRRRMRNAGARAAVVGGTASNRPLPSAAPNSSRPPSPGQPARPVRGIRRAPSRAGCTAGGHHDEVARGTVRRATGTQGDRCGRFVAPGDVIRRSGRAGWPAAAPASPVAPGSPSARCW